MADAQPANPLWNAVSQYAVNETGESETGLIRDLVGSVILLIPKAEVEGLRASFQPDIAHYWPGLHTSHRKKGAPALWKYVMDRDTPGAEGFSRFTLLYRKPKMIALQTNHMEAILYAKFYGEPRKVTAWPRAGSDIIVDAIEGPHIDPQTDEERLSVWRVTKGSNVVHESYGVLRLRVVYNLIPFQLCEPHTGKINSGIVTFGGAFGETDLAAKTLRYEGMSVQKELSDSGLAIVDHEFSYRRDGWDETCTSRRYIKRVLSQKIKTLDGDGNVIDDRIGVTDTARRSQMVYWEDSGETRDFNLYEKNPPIDFNSTILSDPHESGQGLMNYLNVNILDLDNFIG